MCFDLSKNSRLKTAKKDILCWKRLQKNGRPNIYGNFSPYKIGKIVCAKNSEEIKIKKLKVVKDLYGSKFINEGIHSYTDKDCFSFPFIIPKDTKYYENDDQYVSMKIKRISKRDVKKYIKE